MSDMPDDLSRKMLPRAGGLALVYMLHGIVFAVVDDEYVVGSDVEGGLHRGRHCAGVTAIWEVTDRDKAVSQALNCPRRSHSVFPTHGPSSLNAHGFRRLFDARFSLIVASICSHQTHWTEHPLSNTYYEGPCH